MMTVEDAYTTIYCLIKDNSCGISLRDVNFEFYKKEEYGLIDVKITTFRGTSKETLYLGREEIKKFNYDGYVKFHNKTEIDENNDKIERYKNKIAYEIAEYLYDRDLLTLNAYNILVDGNFRLNARGSDYHLLDLDKRNYYDIYFSYSPDKDHIRTIHKFEIVFHCMSHSIDEFKDYEELKTHFEQETIKREVSSKELEKSSRKSISDYWYDFRQSTEFVFIVLFLIVASFILIAFSPLLVKEYQKSQQNNNITRVEQLIQPSDPEYKQGYKCYYNSNENRYVKWCIKE